VKAVLWLLLATAIFESSATAQARVVQPEPPLDSIRAALRNALLVLRDSLLTIDGAAARLQRDYRQASAESLVSRARMMQQACAASARTLPRTRQAVTAARLMQPRELKRRAELVEALDRLKPALADCETTFSAMSRPDQGETVRGYGNDRALRVQRALRKYEQTLSHFFSGLGIRAEPSGRR
jgi:hypothetical protein